MLLQLLFTYCWINFIRCGIEEDVQTQYIVKFHNNSTRTFEQQLELIDSLMRTNHSGLDPVQHQILHRYQRLYRGICIQTSSDRVDILKTHEEVMYVENDDVLDIEEIQTPSPWGLARLSQRERYNNFTVPTFQYPPSAGEGATVYILDTGINLQHDDFENRARWGATLVKNGTDDDLQGHGTHCAGVVGGRFYGIAKNVELVAVKILNDQGKGANSQTIAGIEWVIENADRNRRNIISMSLGGKKSQLVNEAVEEAYQQGFIVVVSAGNKNEDSCNRSPASTPNAVTVGATDMLDRKAKFSNHGSCVDIFAPGVNITSAYKGGSDATRTLSGTSMATPHITGILASYWSLNPSLSHLQVIQELYLTSTNNVITDMNSTTVTVNRIGFNRYV